MSVFLAFNRKPINIVDPDFKSKVEHSFGHSGLKRLGGELVAVEGGSVLKVGRTLVVAEAQSRF